MLYFLSFIISFCAVFLKGFQIKNVQGNHLKSVAVTSYLIAAFEVITVTLIVKGGWWIILTAGTGGTLGMLISIKLHQRLFYESK